jgi:hypothetical protein
MNINALYKKIKSLSERPGTDGERLAAMHALKRLRAKYGEINDDINDIPIDVRLNYNSEWERLLTIYIAEHLELHAFSIKYGGQKKKITLIKATETTAPFIRELYTMHRKKLRERITVFALGYLTTALPVVKKPDKSNCRELDPEMLAIARAGFSTGRDNIHTIRPKLADMR